MTFVSRMPSVSDFRKGTRYDPANFQPEVKKASDWRCVNWKSEDGETLSVVNLVGDRQIEGVCSTDTLSEPTTGGKKHVDPRGCNVKLPVPLLFSHDSSRIGLVKSIRKSKTEIFARAILFPEGKSKSADYAWDLIQSGEVSCFSVCISVTKSEHIDGRTFCNAWTLKELSVCRQGANPDATFKITRSGPPDSWQKQSLYRRGQRVLHNGNEYICKHTHNGYEPGRNIEVWQRD